MKVELWSIGKLIPYARNARIIPQSAVNKVAASIQEFGWQQPIVVDSECVVIAGHVRLLAARQLGETNVPVYVATGLTPAQVKAFRLMDNRSHQESGWDLELLGIELLDLKALNLDFSLTGFDADEISGFLASGGLNGKAAPEEFPEFDETIKTEHECPKCGYRWSGGSSAIEAAAAQEAE